MRETDNSFFCHVQSSNKERKEVVGYFLFSMAATCVLESQVGFIYIIYFLETYVRINVNMLY